MKQMHEAISKFNIMGSEYVKVDELNALISVMQQKYREGTEPGYMSDNAHDKVVSDVTLNHLKATINRERNFDGMLMRLYKTRIEREEREQAEQAEQPKDKPKPRKAHIPARYTVWHYGEDEETTQDSFGFVRWEKGLPLFSNKPCMAMWFVNKGMAEMVAEKLGDGFEVVDMWDTMTKEERLLRAIFCDDEDEDEPEYHGDGTRAEDEDWDVEDE